MTSSAYFERLGPDRYQPLPTCAGAWNTEELHVSPVNGLLLHVIEQWLVEHEQADLTIVRVSLDYLGVVDFTECTTSVELLRGGRAVELVEGIVSQHGRPVIRARVWRVTDNDTSEVAGGELEPLAPPSEARVHDLTVAWPGRYIEDVEFRALDGPVPGHVTGWLTTPHDIVAGDPTTDLARFVLMVDTMNGISVRESPDEWQFPNVDLTIHLLRRPSGRWIGFDTHVTFGSSGHGLTSAVLFDELGHVGHAEQALLVRRRG